jgi:catechol 2,3-dioxygenase-like lactoylglutathione lyase family enzyme
MLAGVHALLYAHDAEAARAFFRDVLELDALDEGDGWLYFALPPAELAVHPGPGITPGRAEGRAEVYLMCTDLAATRSGLEAKGVGFTEPVTDEGWGLLTFLAVPGFGPLGLYEPRHASPLPAFRPYDDGA